MIDYQAIAAKASTEQDDPTITAEYLEGLDNRSDAEWIEHEAARHKRRIQNGTIAGGV
jgi:hypothetical protein